MEPQKQIWGHLAAFFTIFVWGITFISTKMLLVSFTPVEIMFYRLVLAVLALCIASPPRLAWCRPGRQRLRD
jgi:drug/metabolite transporter (DMT)-like permease